MNRHTEEEPKAPKWTIAKEIFIGSLPLIIAIITFGGLLYGNQRAMEVRIDQLEKSDVYQQAAASSQRAELLVAVASLGTKMEAVQQAVARLSALSTRSEEQQPQRRMLSTPSTR